jgi:outer membrane protein assembly factor BamA
MWVRRFAFALALGTASACAALPKNQYGVEHIEWKGVEQMSQESLEACLVTKEREPWTLRLGLSEARCGEPPFDVNVPGVGLVTWPWAEWPIYDAAIFELDRRRILRWYEARGFYDARIDEVEYFAGGRPIEDPDRCTGGDCALVIRLRLTEGEPVFVTEVRVTSRAALPPAVLEELRGAPRLAPGQRFDEATYTRDKERLAALMHEEGYARAEVTGTVEIDRDERTVRVEYAVEPGVPYRFGAVRVEGHGDLSAAAIREVAALRAGDPFSDSEIADAEGAVYALGVFSTVRIDPEFREDSDVADLVIRVQRARTERFRIGAGVMSGTLQRTTTYERFDVPEWDVHLLFGYSNENFLGDMRKLRIEERPRLIMLRQFPDIPEGGPRPGNSLTLRFEQPRFPERRTVTFFDAEWDYGPDPYYGFFRHDLATRIGVRRKFWRQRIAVEVALQHDLFDITDDGSPDTVSSYRLPFADQQIRLDLRNDEQRPTRGLYVATVFQQTARLGYGSWTYLRVLPEARVYQRLFWGVVLASRFAVGALFVEDSSPALDPTSRLLGPQTYRLRGGGPSSHRGFSAGTLGDGIDGGQRRWEGSVELRIPLGGRLGTALFFDTGDVNRESRVRLDHWNAAVGLGFRYYTSFAPIRLDAGWRIPALAVLGESSDGAMQALPSAVHLTLGEAY